MNVDGIMKKHVEEQLKIRTCYIITKRYSSGVNHV